MKLAHNSVIDFPCACVECVKKSKEWEDKTFAEEGWCEENWEAYDEIDGD